MKDKQLDLNWFSDDGKIKGKDKLTSTTSITSKDPPPPEEDRIGWDTPIKSKNVNPTDTVKELVKIIEKNRNYFGGWTNSFENILDLILYALEEKEDEYMKLVNKMDKRAVNAAAEICGILMKAFCHDYAIYDYLGCVYMNIASLSKSKWFGQYFTPFNVCTMMAKIQLGDVKLAIKDAKIKGKKLTVNDPCIGSGAMILAYKSVIIKEVGLSGLDWFEFSGTDIDPICVKMCQIQMLLTDYKYMTNLLLLQLNKIVVEKKV